MTLSRPEEPFIEECFFLGVPPFSGRRLVRARAHPRSQRASRDGHLLRVSPSCHRLLSLRHPRDSARGCRPVEIPVHASWKPELPVHASLDPTVTGLFPRNAVAWGRLCPSTSVTRLSNVGSHSAGAIHARHDDPCGVARSSRRFSRPRCVTPCEGDATLVSGGVWCGLSDVPS
jgi:hypothetical protein